MSAYLQYHLCISSLALSPLSIYTRERLKVGGQDVRCRMSEVIVSEIVSEILSERTIYGFLSTVVRFRPSPPPTSRTSLQIDEQNRVLPRSTACQECYLFLY
jgi:hypothetical protein